MYRIVNCNTVKKGLSLVCVNSDALSLVLCLAKAQACFFQSCEAYRFCIIWVRKGLCSKCKRHLKWLGIDANSELINAIHVITFIFTVQGMFIHFKENRSCLLSFAYSRNYVRDYYRICYSDSLVGKLITLWCDAISIWIVSLISCQGI